MITENVDQLIEKWDGKGFKVSEISDQLVRENTAKILENEHRYILEASSTLSTDIADFKKIIMPLTRRIFPNLIANDLVGVQPMSGPVGLAYALRFKAGNAETNYNSGTQQEVGYNTVDKDYSGSVLTSAGERWGSTDPTKTKEIPEAQMSIEQVSIEAKTRKLRARYSLESAQDLRNVHGLNVEAEMTNMLQYEISAEIDRELVDRINTLADTNSSDYVVSAGDGQWEAEKFRNLYTRIVKEASAIATRTRRGAGNFIICSSNVVTALDSLNNFLIQPTSSGPMNLSPGVAKVGSIENRFTVYRDTFATSDYITVGYKGPGAANSGVVYCPYVPIMISKATEEGSFYPIIGVMTRYGVVDHLFGGSDFYSKINVDFTNVF
jgi:hypothetical protein